MCIKIKFYSNRKQGVSDNSLKRIQLFTDHAIAAMVRQHEYICVL